jgi:hypothetical protein
VDEPGRLSSVDATAAAMATARCRALLGPAGSEVIESDWTAGADRVWDD